MIDLPTIPGLTETSLLPMAAEAAGIAFDRLVATILASALCEDPAVMTIEDSLAVLHPAAPAFSPDGARIAFAVEEAFSRRDEGVRSRIWIAAADGSGAREATRGPWSDTAPCWSPDGRTLAFLSDRGHQGRHSRPPAGGRRAARPVPIGDIAGSVEQIRFSADWRTILALAADPGSDRAGAESATRIDEAETDPQVSVAGRALAAAVPDRRRHRRDRAGRPGRRQRLGVRLARRRRRRDRVRRPVRERLVRIAAGADRPRARTP